MSISVPCPWQVAGSTTGTTLPFNDSEYHYISETPDVEKRELGRQPPVSGKPQVLPRANRFHQKKSPQHEEAAAEGEGRERVVGLAACFIEVNLVLKTFPCAICYFCEENFAPLRPSGRQTPERTMVAGTH
ncbi:MAG: hypothetical protein ACYC9I_09565, partial [Desulfuromonadales bacterium]